MGHIRTVDGWAPLRWLPFIERRRVGLFMDTYPVTPLGPFWFQYRLRRRGGAS